LEKNSEKNYLQGKCNIMAKQTDKEIPEDFGDLDQYDPELDDPALEKEFEKEMQEELPPELQEENLENESENEEQIEEEKEVETPKKKKQTRKKSDTKTKKTKKKKELKDKTDKEDLEEFKVPTKPKEIDTDYLDTIITQKATEKVDVPKIEEIE